MTARGENAETAAALRRGLVMAVLLAGLAGMVDAIGYIRLQHLFVSYMSGNSTQFAIAIGRGRFAEAGQILALIVLFVIGAAGGRLLAHSAGPRHLSAVLVTVTGLLTLAALFGTAPVPMVLAMGALNAAMRRAGSVAVSLTFVTGTLVRFGEGLAGLVLDRGAKWIWAEQALPWLGLVAGGALAAAMQAWGGSAASWAPVLTAAALLVWSLALPAPD